VIRRVTLFLFVLVTALAAAATLAVAADEDYAPLDRQGPPLSVPVDQLAAAYRCHGDFSSPLLPVLFVPGTSVTVDESFSWNYANAFDAEGRPYCTIQPPQRTQADIQVAGEYVVHAIRETFAQAGRPIAVLGHSQGGMSPRWALRFWPDTRAMVEDQIGMAPSNHGTFGDGCTAEEPCVEALWQQSPGSAFLQALNSRSETMSGIDYTVIYSESDDRVPNESSILTTGDGDIANVSIQSICPGTPWGNHLLVGTIDPAAYALVHDALEHDGPADPARIDPAVCTQLVMPGVTVDLELANLVQLLLAQGLQQVPGNPTAAPFAAAEPPLKCYVTAAGCSATSGSDGSDGVDDDADGTGDDAEAGDDVAPDQGDLPAPGGGDGIEVTPQAGGTDRSATTVGEDALPRTGSTTSFDAVLVGLAIVVLGAKLWSAGRLTR